MFNMFVVSLVEDTVGSAIGTDTSEVGTVCGSKVNQESSDRAKVSQDGTEKSEFSQDSVERSEINQDDTDSTKDSTTGTDAAVSCDKEEVIDPYSYLARDGFTSEIFKIEVYNLPKKFGISVSAVLLNFQLCLDISCFVPTFMSPLAFKFM